MSFTDCLKLFIDDQNTHGIIIIGEIGGSEEEEAAEFIKLSGTTKPIVGFVAGKTAPPGKRMGHAGAISSGSSGSAASKIEAMESAGIIIAKTPAVIGKTMLEAMNNSIKS